jgi:hypothetical protein
MVKCVACSMPLDKKEDCCPCDKNVCYHCCYCDSDCTCECADREDGELDDE